MTVQPHFSEVLWFDIRLLRAVGLSSFAVLTTCAAGIHIRRAVLRSRNRLTVRPTLGITFVHKYLAARVFWYPQIFHTTKRLA